VSGDQKGRSRGSREPRRLGDILAPALARIGTSDEARAFGAWARAAGDQVAAGARPRNFSRGVLTVECTSSVWANELTYLGGRILARMDEVAPGHPVRRFRFMVEREPLRQEEPPSAANDESRNRRPAPPDVEGARAQAEGVRDERLRAAIEAALRRSSEESSRTPGDPSPES